MQLITSKNQTAKQLKKARNVSALKKFLSPARDKLQKLIKAFRLKLLELCKTRAKKSSPDMFNFCAVVAGHNMVTDTGRTSTCRRKFKASSLQTKGTKNEVPFENMGFNGKQFEDL